MSTTQYNSTSASRQVPYYKIYRSQILDRFPKPQRAVVTQKTYPFRILLSAGNSTSHYLNILSISPISQKFHKTFFLRNVSDRPRDCLISEAKWHEVFISLHLTSLRFACCCCSWRMLHTDNNKEVFGFISHFISRWPTIIYDGPIGWI